MSGMLPRIREFLGGTLRRRLVLGMATVHALMISLVVLGSTMLLHSLLLESKVEETVALSQSLAISAAGWLAADDISGLQELVEAQRRYPEMIFAMLTDKDGRILASTDRPHIGSYLLDLPKAARLVIFNQSITIVDVAVPAMLGAECVGWARIGMGQQAATRKLMDISRAGLLYLLAAIASGSLVAWLISFNFTRRLYAIQDTITQIRSGVRTARSTVGGTDEAASIAHEFNAMLDMLDARDRELERSQKDLHKREELLGESQRIGQIGSWDWDAVRDTIWWSDEYCRIFDRNPDEPPPEYLEHLEVYTPESKERLDAVVRHAMETGEPYELDLELARPNAATQWIVARGEAKRDDTGAIWGLRGTAQNITERKRAEQELKRLTLRNEMILNSAGEGIFGTDSDGAILFMNAAAQSMLGFQMADILGKDSHALFHHSKSDGTPYPLGECALHVSLKSGMMSRRGDDVFWKADGRMIAVEYTSAPLMDGGRTTGAVIVFQDTANRKRAEEEIRALNENLEKRVKERTSELRKKSDELRDSQMALMNIVEDLNEKAEELESANERLKDLDRLKSLFIATMSHELRTPLNSIIGFSSVLLNEWVGALTTEQKDDLAAILRSGKHLLALINDVIDVSKIEAGKMESVEEEFDVAGVAIEAAEAVSEDARKKDLAIEVKAINMQVYGDRRRLLQCLLNLASNAVRYTDSGSIEIRVDLVDGEETLECSVSDTGIGISPEDMPKLFSPFVRIVLPRRPLVPGTGLGLYLVKKLVREVLKGDIDVHSEYGKGSRFALRLPMAIWRRRK
ncbi:MAG TPA: ATP-binding protein [bacterium]|nr:ATP-binding protein [bacterium]